MNDIHTTMPDVFVIHVRRGYEERGRHMKNMLGELHIPFEFILDGDISDLTDEWIKQHFTGQMLAVSPAVQSCSAKHLLAMQRIVENELPGALILEDDITLKKRFKRVMAETMQEFATNEYWQTSPTLISFEDTRMRYVERSRRIKGRHLYKGDRDRFAGAYYVNNAAAREILHMAVTKHLDEPIDLFHNELLKANRLNYLWCEPTVATQGSFNGSFRSTLVSGPSRWKVFKRLFKHNYRRLLYELR